MKGVMECGTKTVSEVMQKIEDMFYLDSEEEINDKLRFHLYDKGHSRIPIKFKNHNKYKILLMKDLVILKNGIFIKDITILKDPLIINENLNVLMLLNKFQEGISHFAMVKKEFTDQESISEDE